MSSIPFAPIQFLPLGAIIQSFHVGETNIVLGFPNEAAYKAHNSPFFGETIGRVANRISGAKINSLNGSSYTLVDNERGNSLHGGAVGWGKRVWNGPELLGLRDIPGVEGLEGGESVRFTLRSETGEEGYPGTVDVSVIYTTGTQKTKDGKSATVLAIEYEGKLVGDAEETVLNLTNHSYFNLSGESTIEGTEVELATNTYLPVNSVGIPTGGSTSYPGVEANKSFTLGLTEPDIDDCFVFDTPSSPVKIDTRSSPLQKLVAAYHPKTEIHLEVLSTDPAFQFYTGKHINTPAVDGVPKRVARSGFCVEPSRYVNAINVEEWKDQVVLKKGEVYGSRVVYRGWSDK